ncbi:MULTISPECIES: adenylate kinase [Pseudothermotoga]|jgi:adenylate kinase|uniref:Adenylate kinase n=1 Tax=Pseudothermotoga lettingae (strain ATCC BAA-301 / DSM 14385 / NBRC 107922 / TMO) TaxID=416591 RepID=KAD_PSELT|nr:MULTISPECIES: adenylate kinase [Pseudothermotoga]A8F4T2.1 RecName: Full=Adenylate kinase; Short=AK; AltName: Full=ATP-AMP transphosphorylase; AltName: Full=ATP:AMP phosphotransferase; AltName: Full=Adenylate monophosphate kinase [Pseudothermotoga lettingae TMO]ABV33166.1 Nucleoside-triphosphate--adenylate kinase [Pseudothermotoga lettingae TMO]KUK21657.1 MAG: Adenylate kinase [Pseudothermotoga lettingae]MDI3494433.1 adenylate kinase [Pseudothermotoga sp.]MDK2884172.1 adenylate kinase [Pseud
MKIVLLGAPGAGKGTLAKDLSIMFSVPHISTGDMFREAVAAGTELGVKVQNILSSGALVPDEIVNQVVEERLRKQDCEKGFIFDGYPRTIAQAIALDEILQKMSKKLDLAIYLEASEETVVKRLTSRRICPKCGKIYNLISMPPVSDQICDDCGEQLVIREDDKEEVVRKRYRLYLETTAPLVEYYSGRDILVSVNSERDHRKLVEDVSRLLKKVIS